MNVKEGEEKRLLALWKMSDWKYKNHFPPDGERLSFPGQLIRLKSNLDPNKDKEF